jgi:glucuronokinase
MAEFLELELDPASLAELALSVETDELGIAAGLQDRVAQAYGGLTYMDFDPELVSERGHPAYEALDPGLLPPLFVAHQAGAAEPSNVVHASLRRRFAGGEPEVAAAMSRLGELAEGARAALLARDPEAFGQAMDATFDVRRSILELDPRQVRMVELARSMGAAVNFAGSGGAIVGMVGRRSGLEELAEAFAAERCGLVPCAPALPARAATVPAKA